MKSNTARIPARFPAYLLFISVSFILPAFAAVPNSVTVTTQSGAQTNRPFSISRVFAIGDISQYAQARVNGTPVTTQCDVKTRWSDGSVKHAMISFLANVPSSGSLTVDFVNQSSGNNTGFMDKAAMLAVSWGAQIEATNGSTLTASARQILTDWNGTGTDTRVTYWLKGSVCTQVILEDRTVSLTYDIGFDANKSMHPIFVVTFYPGNASGVKVEMILENMWTTKLQDQTYSLALKTGNPLGSAVYSKASFTHYAKTRWRKTFWSGTTPGNVKIDYNLAYLAYSKAIPNYDLTKVPGSSVIQSEISNFSATDQGDINGSAFWLKYMPQTGGRDDIGLMPGWYARYIYSFDPGMYDMMLGNAACASYVPIHVRESDNTLKFDSANSVSAFGRPLSVDARPTAWGTGTGVGAVGTISNGSGWTSDVAHEPAFAYIPYLITGDWYFLEELYFYGAQAVASTDPANVLWGRNGSWGILSWSMQTRGTAWGLRDVVEAASMAPDGSPEKAYFTQKFNNNIAVREGNMNITTGSFYDPSASSMWTWGRNSFSRQLTASPLGIPNFADEYASHDGMAATVQYPDGPWQYGYLMIVMGHAKELGFPIDKVQANFAKFYINGLTNPAFNPYLIAAYRVPVTLLATGQYVQTWDGLKQGFLPNYQVMTSWPENDEGNVGHGYPHIQKAATSFTVGLSDGPYTGQAAWDWINAHVGYQSSVGSNPRWAILPRTSTTVTPAGCDLNSDGLVSSLDAQLAINQALAITACTNGDLDLDGRCTVIDVQRVVNAVLGGICRIGP